MTRIKAKNEDELRTEIEYLKEWEWGEAPEDLWDAACVRAAEVILTQIASDADFMISFYNTDSDPNANPEIVFFLFDSAHAEFRVDLGALFDDWIIGDSDREVMLKFLRKTVAKLEMETLK